MRTSPSIVPRDEDVYLVEDDLGRLGRVWREVDSERTDLETVVTDMLSGEYSNPVRVIAFNISEGWSKDVSKDIAIELERRCDLTARALPASLEGFVDRHEGSAQLRLPLAIWEA